VVCQTAVESGNPGANSERPDAQRTGSQTGAQGGILVCPLDGNRQWQRDLGPVLSRWGNGGSPILYAKLEIVFHGPETPSILYGLDRESGKIDGLGNEVYAMPIFGAGDRVIVGVVGHNGPNVAISNHADTILFVSHGDSYKLKTSFASVTYPTFSKCVPALSNLWGSILLALEWAFKTGCVFEEGFLRKSDLFRNKPCELLWRRWLKRQTRSVR
jgi:hypothetical protein